MRGTFVGIFYTRLEASSAEGNSPSLPQIKKINKIYNFEWNWLRMCCPSNKLPSEHIIAHENEFIKSVFQKIVNKLKLKT